MPTFFNNAQPAIRLNEGIALNGLFPSQGGSGNPGMYIGMFHTYAFNFSTGGVATAFGQLLPINQNQALFALLGTNYGGNGVNNFALPDLIGRQMTSAGNGPGIDPVLIGERSGTLTSSLATSNLPASIGGQAQPLDEDGLSLGTRYLIATSGIYPSQGGSGSSLELIGSIVESAFDFVPSGYAACNGQLLSINQNQALFSILGTTYGGDGISTFALPDFRGRTAIGAGGNFSVGEVAGQSAVTITNANLPTNMGGNAVPIDNHEPSLAVSFLIALDGIFPSQGGGGSDPVTPKVGEIIAFAGTFVPSGFARCDGQLLNIVDNETLFQLIGTIYGGDGQTTFALPDLRGRSIVGVDNTFNVGELVGTDSIVLTSADFPDLNYSGTDLAGTHYGADGNDTINGLGGIDTVNGGLGGDTLNGGTGSDTVNGGAGQDKIVIGNGLAGDVDHIDGGTDRDLLDMSAITNGAIWIDFGYNLGPNQLFTLNGFASITGMESMIGTSFNDTMRGDRGSNFIDGGAGNDTILSYSPYDTLTPYASLGDVILGGAGNDLLFSGTGNDYLDGGADNDTIEVGAGTDTVVTGTGNDIVFFSPNCGTDTVTDFTGGPGVVDVLKLYGFGTAFDTAAEVIAASSQHGADTWIVLPGTTIILQNFTATTLANDDFVFV
jgi:microcystin-dependent protein